MKGKWLDIMKLMIASDIHGFVIKDLEGNVIKSIQIINKSTVVELEKTMAQIL